MRPPLGLRLLLPLCLAACSDFPNEPTRAVTLEPVGWTSLAVTDVETLSVRAAANGEAEPITGLGVTWMSSDEALLQVRQLQPPAGASREDSLAAQLRAVATAHAGGVATVSVIVEGGAAFEPDTMSDTIRVTQRYVSVSAGYHHSCGTTIDNKAFCWGTGLIGNGSTGGSPIPVQVGPQLEFRSVHAGEGYSCGLLSDGRAFCWGTNRLGTVGNSLPTDELAPVSVSLGQTFTSVSAGRSHACGITGDTGFCWGNHASWQLGDGGLGFDGPVPPFDTCDPFAPQLCSLRPRPVQNRDFEPTELLAIAPGVAHTCAVRVDGVAICWGTGSAEIGSDTIAATKDSLQYPPTVSVGGGVTFGSVTAGLSHSCGLTAGNSLAFCWGLNSHGQLGTSSAASTCPAMGDLVSCSPTPLAVSDARTFQRLSSGERSTCGIDEESNVYCWGSNQFGQLGTLDALELCETGARCSVTPLLVEIPGNPRIIAVSAGQRHACAVTQSGAAYCWGDPTGGKLGRKSLENQTEPTSPTRVDEPS